MVSKPLPILFSSDDNLLIYNYILFSATFVNTENRNKSLTSSWVVSNISVFIMVCISSFVIYPLSTLSGELIYPVKGF